MAQALTLAVALSMLLTPLLLALHDRFLIPRLARDDDKRPADTPEAARVIVAGLGRVGQVVARLLNAASIHPTVLDDNPDHVEQSRKFGFRVFYGDATRLDLLHAAGADRADFLIIAIEDPAAITSNHFFAAALSPVRQAPSASSSRAMWRNGRSCAVSGSSRVVRSASVAVSTRIIPARTAARSCSVRPSPVSPASAS